MSDRPNLLFIFSDQHAARIAGCYGDPVARTPHIDRLAADGVVFDNAYCPSPLCTPSRMSMMTARYPHRNQVWGNQDVLHSGLPTMAHSLGAAGYRPTLVGRLHSVGPDQLLGYAQRKVGDHHANWLGMPRVDMGPLQDTASPDRQSLKRSGAGLSAYEVKDADVVDTALQTMDQIAADMQAGRIDRFALTVGLMLPHAPFVAQREDFERFSGKVGPAEIRRPAEGQDHSWLNAWRRRCDILDVSADEEVRARTAYYALVSVMDRMIGQVLDRLESLGLADNTLVVYASDHGEQLGQHGLWWKHTFYEDSVRVPMVLRWPGELPAGERRGQIVNLTDLTATMIEALGAPALVNGDGNSFLEVAKDTSAPWRDMTFCEYCYGSRFDWGPAGTGQNRMVRTARYKLNYYHGHPPQLFDLIDDPREQIDLASSSGHSAVRRHLEEEVLRGWDPVEIEANIERNIADKQIMKDWAEGVRPSSQYLWPMKPEHNRLD